MKGIEGIENHCFHQILSTADTSVFAQIPYICPTAPFRFQELGQLPWNSSQLTKAFLVDYADLVSVVTMKEDNTRLYDSHPGLFAFISNPVRAGVYHQFVRSHFIQITDKALEDDYFNSLLDDGSERCVSPLPFHCKLNDFLFKAVPLHLIV